jgi:UPF0716 family protein affecting phage T7 exclusion
MLGLLFLDVMTLIFIGYFIGIAVTLFKINLAERKGQGMTTRQALKDIVRDIFYIQKFGRKDE